MGSRKKESKDDGVAKFQIAFQKERLVFWVSSYFLFLIIFMFVIIFMFLAYIWLASNQIINPLLFISVSVFLSVDWYIFQYFWPLGSSWIRTISSRDFLFSINDVVYMLCSCSWLQSGYCFCNLVTTHVSWPVGLFVASSSALFVSTLHNFYSMLRGQNKFKKSWKFQKLASFLVFFCIRFSITHINYVMVGPVYSFLVFWFNIERIGNNSWVFLELLDLLHLRVLFILDCFCIPCNYSYLNRSCFQVDVKQNAWIVWLNN